MTHFAVVMDARGMPRMIERDAAYSSSVVWLLFLREYMHSTRQKQGGGAENLMADGENHKTGSSIMDLAATREDPRGK